MAPVKKTSAPGMFSVLLRDIRSLQVKVEYPKLVAKLQIDLAEAGDRQLRELIAGAGEDRRVSGLIYRQAKWNRAVVQREWDTESGKWMFEGRAAIAKAKKEKKWDGSVYSLDVDRWVLANIPEATALHKKLQEAEQIYGTAKSLYKSYEYRLSALQTYARLIEKKIEVTLEDLAELQDMKRKQGAADAIGGKSHE